LAHCWEDAEKQPDGLPKEVHDVLSNSVEPLLQNVRPILAIPEFKVDLPGGERSSQNDIFVLARSEAGPVAMMVEGKVNESFGPTVGEWRQEESPGKKNRLSFLLTTLGLPRSVDDTLRYQLLHRTASAVLEGKRYRAAAAVMLVHSFSTTRAGWNDYAAFLKLFGVDAVVGAVQQLPDVTKSRAMPLFTAWIAGDSQFLTA
jgi:hypothetical protein